MSRPGFPVEMSQSIPVTNHYYDSSFDETSNGSDTCFIRSEFQDKDGANTPGWPTVIRTNGYLRSNFQWSQTPLSVTGSISGGDADGDMFYGEWGNAFGMGYDPWTDADWGLSAEAEDLVNRLTSRLISQMQSNRVNLGEIFATRAQAANMFGDTCKRLASSFNRLKKGDFSGAARSLSRGGRGSGGGGGKNPSPRGQGIPEQWLALRYGWIPLVQDCYNSAEIVRKAWNDNGEAFTVNAAASIKGSTRTIEVHPYPHGPTLRWRSTNRAVSGKASIVYGVANGGLNSLSQLGITNPASLAWELLPYSFVLDWMYPVGNYLSSLDYHLGLEFRHGWISLKHSGSIQLSLKDTSPSIPYLGGTLKASWSGGSGQGTGFVLERRALSAFPDVPRPQLKDPTSLLHIANGLSLLAGAFGR